ncbi:hypothetical protein RSOLAG1IB_04196 [Rhizoctonia solani AG-1 IB]|uniref:IncA domain-containing protein n=1 Tax=Thanatephorus cucumeris (strain AG1-IB / isolate 7/3/14) TaxID=1108050 RepID=A0A0B7FXN2_THACB|nr:hypothetical protein RSOLAG1IB_04196 [Rhizoctonia solani AG-1 IB]
MATPFLCHCNHIAAPAVIEGSTVLVCRHLLQGSQYRTDPHHIPCGFKLTEDTGPELQPIARATVLHNKPTPFKALPLPRGADPLDLYRPKKDVAASSAQAEVAMEIDNMPIEGTQFVLPQQKPGPMDAQGWQRRCMIAERQLQASEDEVRRLKRQMEVMKRELSTLDEQNRTLFKAKEEAMDYKGKYESVRAELHDLRRSTRVIFSNALQPNRSSSPSF